KQTRRAIGPATIGVRFQPIFHKVVAAGGLARAQAHRTVAIGGRGAARWRCTGWACAPTIHVGFVAIEHGVVAGSFAAHPLRTHSRVTVRVPIAALLRAAGWAGPATVDVAFFGV